MIYQSVRRESGAMSMCFYRQIAVQQRTVAALIIDHILCVLGKISVHLPFRGAYCATHAMRPQPSAIVSSVYGLVSSRLLCRRPPALKTQPLRSCASNIIDCGISLRSSLCSKLLPSSMCKDLLPIAVLRPTSYSGCWISIPKTSYTSARNFFLVGTQGRLLLASFVLC